MRCGPSSTRSRALLFADPRTSSASPPSRDLSLLRAAFDAPYIGTAADHLAAFIEQQEADATTPKAERSIRIVQSSGTGKSRAVRELGKQVRARAAPSDPRSLVPHARRLLRCHPLVASGQRAAAELAAPRQRRFDVSQSTPGAGNHEHRVGHRRFLGRPCQS